MQKEKKFNTKKDIEFILPICRGNFDILPYEPVLIDYTKNQILREYAGNTTFINAIERILCFNSLDFSDYELQGEGYYTYSGFTIDPDQQGKQILEVFCYNDDNNKIDNSVGDGTVLEVRYGSRYGYAGKVVADNEELRRIFTMGLLCPNISIVTANSDLERAYSTYQSDVSFSTTEVSPFSAEGQIFSVPSNDFFVETNTASEAMIRIESNRAIQGGDYCLKGTRITIQGILEAIRAGRTIDEMVATLKKYFRCNITKEELEKAIAEYKMIANNFSA